MKKKTILTLGILTIISGGALALAGVSQAYQGNPNTKGPNYSVERHDAMLKAFQNNDYDAWKNLMQGRGRITQIINKDNFSKFAQAQQLALEGKTAEAQKIRAELGLGSGGNFGRGRGVVTCLNR